MVGENGAGKTTLMSILFGMPVISETGGFGGKIILNGEEVHFTSPFDALDAGIGMVHQEFSLIPGFTTTENIMLNREITKNNILADIFGPRLCTLNRAEMKKSAEESVAKLGVEIDSETKIAEMPVGHKQFVEIAREISREKVKLLVLDEPTGELDPASSVQIFSLLKKLNEEKGITVVIAEQKIMLLCEYVKKLIVLEKGNCVHYGEIRSTLTHQKEMEEAGINCPRVLTLTGKMVEEGLVPASFTNEDRICLDAKEAAVFVEKCIGAKTE